MLIPLYVTLGLCAVFAAMLVWRYDMYEHEPWFMLVVAAGLGAAVMVLMGPAEMFTLRLWTLAAGEFWPAWYISMVAATHEEVARLVIVAGIAVVARTQFNDPMDGIIYGSIVGLGMAVEESISHMSFYGVFESKVPTLPATEPVRLCGHLVMGGITTFALGMARMRMRGWLPVLLACLTISTGIHFLWDWIAFTAMRQGGMQTWHTACAIALMLFGMLVYGFLVSLASEWSRRRFAPHRPRLLWGWPFPRG